MGIWLVGMSLWESIGEIAGLLLVFILILVLTWVTTRWIAKNTAGQLRSGNIRVLETYKLAPNRYLQIVKVAGKYLVLAVSREQISLVTELTEEELQLQEEKATLQTSFQDILKKVAGNRQNDEKK